MVLKYVPYSFSKIELFDTCPFAFKCRYVDGLKEPRGDHLIIGEASHSIFGDYARHCFETGRSKDAGFLENLIKKYTAGLTTGQAAEVRKLAVAFFNNSVSFPATNEGYLIEAEIAFTKDFKQTGWWDEDCFFRFKPDLFYRQKFPGNIIQGFLRDYKTGWRIPANSAVESSLQMLLYAYCFYVLYPGTDVMKVSLDFVRYGVEKSRMFGREDVEHAPEVVMEAIERIENTKDFTPRVSGHCASCGYKTVCPVMREIAKDKIALFTIETREDAEKAGRLILALEAVTEMLKQNLKDWVEFHGPVAVEDIEFGYVFTQTRKVKDPSSFMERLMEQGIAEEDFWEMVSITESRIRKVLKKKGYSNIDAILSKLSRLFEVEDRTSFRSYRRKESGEENKTF
ncbi:MAG TPA: PD-(D/E)XK nuclease family protein [Deltaproteobacteria bacterium]|nr:PD-(D/E)XK nuclease family protein [Deltaproteobacteria bacterium]